MVELDMRSMEDSLGPRSGLLGCMLTWDLKTREACFFASMKNQYNGDWAAQERGTYFARKAEFQNAQQRGT